MTALAANRNNPVDAGETLTDDVAAAVHIYCGALLSRDTSGNSRPARATVTDLVYGIAEEEVDNSAGAAGDLTVKAKQRVGFFVNSSGGDEITKADFGSACYAVDDQTVAKTSNSSTRPAAGVILGLEGSLVRVFVGNTAAYNGDLVSTNDLSDVNDAATARANIGANVAVLTTERLPLDGAGVFYIPLPIGATVVDIRSAVEGATTTTGAATITAALDTTDITDGEITIGIGAVVGEKDSATPSADNVATAGQNLRLTVAPNTQDAAAFARVSVEIQY